MYEKQQFKKQQRKKQQFKETDTYRNIRSNRSGGLAVLVPDLRGKVRAGAASDQCPLCRFSGTGLRRGVCLSRIRYPERTGTGYIAGLSGQHVRGGPGRNSVPLQREKMDGIPRRSRRDLADRRHAGLSGVPARSGEFIGCAVHLCGAVPGQYGRRRVDRGCRVRMDGGNRAAAAAEGSAGGE